MKMLIKILTLITHKKKMIKGKTINSILKNRVVALSRFIKYSRKDDETQRPVKPAANKIKLESGISPINLTKKRTNTLPIKPTKKQIQEVGITFLTAILCMRL